MERDEEPIKSASIVIAFSIEFIKQKEPLRVSDAERENATDESRRMEAELYSATASVSTLDSSLDANKEELERFLQALQLDNSKATEFQSRLDRSLARNAVLEGGNEESPRFSEASDACCN